MIELIAGNFLEKLLCELVEVGQEKFRARSDVKNLRQLIRQRLLRELRLNDELLSYRTIDDAVRLKAIETSALSAVMHQSIPLEMFFDKTLSEATLQRLAKGDGRQVRRVAGIKTEKDLLERWWHRVSLAKIRLELAGKTGDLAYLRRLCFCLRLALEEAP